MSRDHNATRQHPTSWWAVVIMYRFISSIGLDNKKADSFKEKLSVMRNVSEEGSINGACQWLWAALSRMVNITLLMIGEAIHGVPGSVCSDLTFTSCSVLVVEYGHRFCELIEASSRNHSAVLIKVFQTTGSG
ncbi:uncharacterized protein LOC124805127 [Schistocerca piceifrons]|uniref:uncharacterized protein LOC124805127 n=1 Tax=Schistocerca piceifrons TaxID=274613 RepID=UPI001F5F3589|nr:uncharacterized protein LOC124805127 [Schistocerca piceifrons]